MAVRFDASGDKYSSSSSPPAYPFTVTCWAMVVVDRADFSMIWSSDAAQGQQGDFLQFGVGAGVYLSLFNSGIPGAPLVGAQMFPYSTWFRAAVTVDGSGAATIYQGTAGSALTTYSKSGIVNPSGSPTFYIGSSGFSEWWNGRVANFKHYAAVLTQPEIEAEFAQYMPSRTANLVRWHPFVLPETADYSGNGRTLTGTGATTEDGPPIRWGPQRRPRITMAPRPPVVDVGKDVFGTAGFEFAIQAAESGIGITARSWTVVSGPAQVASEIGTTSLLSWFPATAGVYELEYRVTNPAGQGYDTVYATVNATGTVVASASASGTTTTLTCNKPTGVAAGDVMLAVQSGNFNDFDLMDPPAGWQPLFEYDVALDSLHVKGWTLTAGASEPSTYDFTQGSGSAGVVTIVAMRGVVEAGVRLELAPDAGTTATRTAPAVEGAVDGSILLCGAMTNPGAARTWTPPSGMIEQADIQSGTATTHAVASLLDPPDPTGTKDFTLSGTTVAPGGIQWSAVFPLPADPQRRGAIKSMFTVIRTT